MKDPSFILPLLEEFNPLSKEVRKNVDSGLTIGEIVKKF